MIKSSDRIGIFGGAFDPITQAHRKIAEEIAKKLQLSWVMYEPTNNFYEDKKDIESVEHRINMIQLTFDNEKPVNGTLFSIGGVDAFTFEKISTYELLDRYKKMFANNELFFIMGSDNLKTFHTWKQPEKIFDLANLAVRRRGNDDVLNIISSNPILNKNINKIKIINTKPHNLSSTLVRNWLKNKSNISTRYLSKEVLNYIKEHKLYMK